MTYDICVAVDWSIIEVFKDDELDSLYTCEADLDREGCEEQRAAWLSSTIMRWASQTVAQEPRSVMPVIEAVHDVLGSVFSTGSIPASSPACALK